MIKYCPDLIEYEERKSITINTLWESKRFPIVHHCIKEKCVAYKVGKCMKYNNEVEVKEDDMG